MDHPEVVVEFASAAALEEELQGNLAGGGVFARGETGLETGDVYNIVLVHPAADARMTFSGRAVYVDGEGARIAIEGFSPTMREKLRAFVARRDEPVATAPAPVAPVPVAPAPVAPAPVAPAPVAEWDTTEDSELRALGSMQVMFRKPEPKARPAPAVEPEPEPAPAPLAGTLDEPLLAPPPPLASEDEAVDALFRESELRLLPVESPNGPTAPTPATTPAPAPALPPALAPPIASGPGEPLLDLTAPEGAPAVPAIGSTPALDLAPAPEFVLVVEPAADLDLGLGAPPAAPGGADAEPPAADAKAEAQAEADAAAEADAQADRRGKQRNLHERLRGLSVVEQNRVAREGDANERVVLERIYGKSVWEALLRNPRLSIAEVSRISRMGALPRPLLELIVANPAWSAAPQIRRSLLGNPRLPRELGMRLLRSLPKHELKLVPKQTAYPTSVRTAARKLLNI